MTVDSLDISFRNKHLDHVRHQSQPSTLTNIIACGNFKIKKCVVLSCLTPATQFQIESVLAQLWGHLPKNDEYSVFSKRHYLFRVFSYALTTILIN